MERKLLKGIFFARFCNIFHCTPLLLVVAMLNFVRTNSSWLRRWTKQTYKHLILLLTLLLYIIVLYFVNFADLPSQKRHFSGAGGRSSVAPLAPPSGTWLRKVESSLLVVDGYRPMKRHLTIFISWISILGGYGQLRDYF